MDKNRAIRTSFHHKQQVCVNAHSVLTDDGLIGGNHTGRHRTLAVGRIGAIGVRSGIVAVIGGRRCIVVTTGRACTYTKVKG